MAEVDQPRPLAEDDDRTIFDCGRSSQNTWFQRHGWTNHAAGLSRVTVLTERCTGRIIGFATLSATQIERGFLAKSERRNRPDPIPATLLGQLAVDRAFQATGHGRSLLLFSLRTALEASKGVASYAVITHPIDDTARQFYLRWGFDETPFDPKQSMILRMRDIEISFS